MSWDKTDSTLWDIVGPTTMDDLDEWGYAVVKRRFNDALVIRQAFFNYVMEDAAEHCADPTDDQVNRIIDDCVQRVLELGVGTRMVSDPDPDPVLTSRIENERKRAEREDHD